MGLFSDFSERLQLFVALGCLCARETRDEALTVLSRFGSIVSWGWGRGRGKGCHEGIARSILFSEVESIWQFTGGCVFSCAT